MTDPAIIGCDDARYPELLRHVTPIGRELAFAGDSSLLVQGPRIGVIGSRTPRSDAVAVAQRLVTESARAGFTIVSGLAVGIDGLAHEAALNARGRTIAVLPTGLRRVYPAANRGLARLVAGAGDTEGVTPGEHIDAAGLVVTEYGIGDAAPHRFRFLERNRIIAALSDYLVVIQARPQSGSMITANVALDLGIPIGVVPSAPDDPCYTGSTALIHDGADAVVDGASLFRRLELHGIMDAGFADAARRGARIDPLRPGRWIGGVSDEAAIQLELDDHPLTHLLQVPRAVDEIAELSGMTLRDTRSMLLELEADGRVLHTNDGTWIAATALV